MLCQVGQDGGSQGPLTPKSSYNWLVHALLIGPLGSGLRALPVAGREILSGTMLRGRGHYTATSGKVLREVQPCGQYIQPEEN